MKENITFIGAGNMAKAMIGGIVTSGLAAPAQVTASNPSAARLDALKEEFGIHTIQNDNAAAAAQADIVVLSVKPYLYEAVIAEIKDVVKPETIVIMIAAGQTISANEARFAKSVKLARVMPNTPALVGEAMSAVCFNTEMTDTDKEIVMNIVSSFGKAEMVSETMMDTVTGVSGSSPAYVYMFIEAMADAAVLHGMPRAQAYTFAAQSVLGSAKMVLDTGMHPGALKDNVCSPGGTTIEAVAALESSGLRAAVIDAIDVCVKKSQEMSK
ncbi:MAG: pyrroline-5-carboxylate reductase [Clostridia bacterium]|nr:pyrroline-5-carboxylate reductase [Clostridia bacterium]